MKKEFVAVGLDVGNRDIAFSCFGKVAKIPSAFGYSCPKGEIKKGMETAPKSFALLLKRKDGSDKRLWFGPDILGGSTTHAMDEDKLDRVHLAILFRAVLYEWSRKYKTDLSTLGKLNVVCSMPPALHKDRKANAKAYAAYKATFDRGQSHLWIRDGGKVKTQIVTQFGGLVREAAEFATQQKASRHLEMVVDLGYGTTDAVLILKGQVKASISDPSGMVHAFERINPANPDQAELEMLRNKGHVPDEILAYYSSVRTRITRIKRVVPQPVEKITLIGGGTANMTSEIKSMFKSLAPKVVFKNEYVNALANEASARKE